VLLLKCGRPCSHISFPIQSDPFSSHSSEDDAGSPCLFVFLTWVFGHRYRSIQPRPLSPPSFWFFTRVLFSCAIFRALLSSFSEGGVSLYVSLQTPLRSFICPISADPFLVAMPLIHVGSPLRETFSLRELIQNPPMVLGNSPPCLRLPPSLCGTDRKSLKDLPVFSICHDFLTGPAPLRPCDFREHIGYLQAFPSWRFLYVSSPSFDSITAGPLVLREEA